MNKRLENLESCGTVQKPGKNTDIYKSLYTLLALFLKHQYSRGGCTPPPQASHLHIERGGLVVTFVI